MDESTPIESGTELESRDPLEQRLREISEQVGRLSGRVEALHQVVEEAGLIAGQSPSSPLAQARGGLGYMGPDLHHRHPAQAKGARKAGPTPPGGVLGHVSGRSASTRPRW